MSALAPEHVHLDEPRELGRLLKRMRRRQGLAPEDVASWSGLTARTLRRFEAGTSMAQLAKLARVFEEVGFRVRLELVPLEGGEE